MLSDIGRAAIRKTGARVGTSNASTNRVFQSIWRLQRVDRSRKVDNAADRTQLPLSLRRLYATTTKATQTAVPKPKRVATTTTKVKKPGKLPKKAVKKPAAKKPKKKAAIKPKPKPKKKIKKVITPEEKEKTSLKALKAAALSPPKQKPSTAWKVLVSEIAAEKAGSGGTASLWSKEAASKYRSLSPQELEEYNHVANQNKVANTIALKQWTEAHTPEEIRRANNARLQLKRKTGKPRGYTPLKDDRIPKAVTQPYFMFAADRWASGDFKGVKVTDSGTIIRKEFNALSDIERKVYEDRAAADKQRYIEEFKTVFHRDPQFVTKAA